MLTKMFLQFLKQKLMQSRIHLSDDQGEVFMVLECRAGNVTVYDQDATILAEINIKL